MTLLSVTNLRPSKKRFGDYSRNEFVEYIYFKNETCKNVKEYGLFDFLRAAVIITLGICSKFRRVFRKSRCSSLYYIVLSYRLNTRNK